MLKIINPSTCWAKARGLLRIDTESGVFFPRPKGRGFTSTLLSVLRRSVLSLPKENAAECIKKAAFYLIIFILTAFLSFVVYLLSQGRDAAILMYHSIGEPGIHPTSLNMSEATFEKQMKFLSEHHYRVISLFELTERLKAKKKILPKTVIITIDDGYENNYTKAFPILKKYKLPATIFVITNFLGKQETMGRHRFKFMTADMLRQMQSSGLITIGSHTKSHPFLPLVKEKKILDEEIRSSKEILEEILGAPVYAFCYPAGGYTQGIEELVQKTGYKVAVTTLPKKGFAHTDIYALKRIKSNEDLANPFIFFIKTSGYYLRMKETSK